MTPIDYIDTPEKLSGLCQKILIEPWIALDTEFLREKTYYPKFCLLQIATPNWVACIDPLVLPDLSELFEVLYNPAIIKVFHACRQDLEIFYQLTGKVPEPIFDTQIAAPLLGIQENPGYAMLVSTFLNINLTKAHTRTDWSIRPLSPQQLEYAADDVIYLCQIYQIMRDKLKELSRFDWLLEDFKLLNNPELYDFPAEKAWLKVKGKNKLTGRQLSIIQALTQWREETAQREDRPRNWLMRDDLLLELAKLQPASPIELATIRTVNEKTVQRYGRVLCELINAAKQRPPFKETDKLLAVKKTPQQEAVLDVLTAVVRIRAEENALNPIILASRKELEKLLYGDDDCLLLAGWRYSMAGRELQGLLSGDYVLTLQEGEVKTSVFQST